MFQTNTGQSFVSDVVMLEKKNTLLSEIQKLGLELDRLSSKADEAKKTSADLDSLTALLGLRQGELAELNNEKLALEKSIIPLQEQETSLKITVDALKTTKSQIEADILQKQQEHDKNAAQSTVVLNDLVNSANNARDELALAEKKKDDAEASVVSSLQNLAVLGEVAKEADRQIASLNEQVKSLQNSLASLQSELDSNKVLNEKVLASVKENNQTVLDLIAQQQSLKASMEQELVSFNSNKETIETGLAERETSLIKREQWNESTRQSLLSYKGELESYYKREFPNIII